MKQFLSFLFMMLALVYTASAQSEQPQMADAMRSNGKIYVVVVVCLVILLGLIGYVFRIDRKISQLEQQQKD
jgi:cadmium resistance protein CadD (predicted permease)